jgi:type IV pilus assembly protein PilQ
MRTTVRRLALILLMPVAASAAETRTESSVVRLTDVSVVSQPGGTAVHIKTEGAVKYRAEMIDSPARLVIDFEDTKYSWRKTPLTVSAPPVKQIRGSQYQNGIARVVVELSQKAGYSVREDPDGLTVILPSVAPRAAEGNTPAAEPKISATEPKTSAATTPKTGAVGEGAAAVATPGESTGSATSSVKPAKTTAEARTGVRLAQAPAPIPAPVTTPAAERRLISLDFKDADVVNLLRILAAESSKNIVIGDDVKGKMSISLRNVPWEQALDTILESRGLVKVESGQVIRIVSAEQLTKEREARARVEEAKVKAEADVRAKVAEASLKEAEALTRKLVADAAAKEAEARGPLKEETIRLSYADPDIVAETLQGILGIPKEGQKIQGPGILGGPPNPELQPYGAPPASQTVTMPPVSVSQDVLAKGLTIRSHKPTNTIFLRLYEADLERIKKLIRESLDIPLPQVKIEARMEILDRNALEQIGVQWGGLVGGTAATTTLVGQGLQTTTAGGQTVPFLPGFIQGTNQVIDMVPVLGGLGLGGRQSVLAQPSVIPPAIPPATGGLPVSFQTGLPLGGNLVNLPISALPNAGPLPAAGLSFGIVGTKFNINLALQALAEQGKTRTLARPEIVTVENNKATMSLGEEIPYATISSAGTQIQFKEALLKLEVTPTVIQEGPDTKIKLLVVVENNSRGTVVNLGSAGQPPAINRRKAETQVLIKEGDRLIIGGVTTAVNQNTVRKVPVLGDIPLLGYLFRQKENFESGRELVVFLTPSVLRAVLAAPPPPPPAPPAPPAR